jgi:3-deoxy-D-manno-octulosonic-acid transferase
MHGIVRKVNPRVAVITETELWPNFVFALEREGVPCLLVNGRISDRSFPRYRLVKVCMRDVLKRISGMYMQTERDAQRIKAIGAPPEQVYVSGNVKLDSAEVTDPPVRDEALRAEIGVPAGTPLFLAAALARTGAEDPVALDVLERLRAEFADAALMIVPRHPERGPAIEALVAERGYVPRRRSRGDSFDGPARQVFILDTVGELKRFYTLARVVFVGKSLFPPGGGQNMIEPVGLGLPVLYGPYTANFRAIADELVHAGGATRVDSPRELAEAVVELWRDPDGARAMARRGQACIRAQQGATERIVKAILAAAPPAADQ